MVDCSEAGRGPRIGSRGGGIGFGTEKTKQHQSVSLACLVTESGDHRFDEAAFLRDLQVEARKEIESSGAAIVGNETANTRDFSIDYQDKGHKGRISIAGSRQGQYYSLSATIDEEPL